MYMLCNTHNPEMNKILYSWFVNLFLVYFFKYIFFLYDVKIELSKEHPLHSCSGVACSKRGKNKTDL